MNGSSRSSPNFISPSRLARFYFLECERFLRFSSTPSNRRGADGVPEPPHQGQPVTNAILEGGYAWEEEVVAGLSGVVRVADAEAGVPVRDRVFTAEDARALISDLAPNEYVYQPTLTPPSAFYARYDLDPSVVRFSDCRPDLIRFWQEDDKYALQVVDVKASPGVELAHRVQVTLYSLILESLLDDWGVEDRVVSGTGAIWLAERSDPDAFDTRSLRPAIERFLSEGLQPLLAAPADEARWHVYYRCEWCTYFAHCRAEMQATDDVSRVPYISGRTKQFLRDLDPPVTTVAELDGLLSNESRSVELDASASLAGRQRRLLSQVKALTRGEIETFGGHSAAMPRAEHVRVLLTLQREPISGQIYTWGLYAQGLKDIAEETPMTRTGVAAAGDAETVEKLEREFIRTVHGLLRAVHDFNAEQEGWKAQKTLQTFVFDGYERDLLVDLLLRRLQDADVAEEALDLLFHFQQADLLEATDHPGDVVFWPVVDLMRVLRTLFALPLEVTYRFADASKLLGPSDGAFEYRDNDYFTFPFSNQMRSDAIFAVWYRGKDYVDRIERKLRFRLWATNSLVNGVRERLEGEGALFAWPPKFRLTPSADFQSVILSRLAFLARYESVLAYLALREPRLAPEADRRESGWVVSLEYVGGGHFRPDPEQGDLAMEEDQFPNWLLADDSPTGKKELLVYDDYRQRRAVNHLPTGSRLRLASIQSVEGSPPDTRIELGFVHGAHAPELEAGDRYLLTPRFTDFTTDRALKELSELDDEKSSHFVRMLEDPTGTSEGGFDEDLQALVLEVASEAGMTPSQTQALRDLVEHRIQLVWGPPGTGKTHFLALAVLSIAEAHRRLDREFRVLVTAFTHTAIDNCLRKLEGVQSVLQVFEGDLPLTRLGNVTLEDMEAVSTIDPKDGWTWAGSIPISILGGTVWQQRKSVPASAADLVVIDEGSQMKVPEAAIAVRRMAESGQLLVAGDDRQLPPIVLGSYPPPSDGEPILHRSIFEALRAHPAAGEITAMLLENFRMNKTLCRYPAAQLYSPDYESATGEIASSRLALDGHPRGSKLVAAAIDPIYPLVLVVLDGVQAAAENRVEAGLVSELVLALRAQMRNRQGQLYSDDEPGDRRFWTDALFVVSPHHAQIRAIEEALWTEREWSSRPFVGTVDRMQGQECDAVITSYGVADPEYATREKEFVYSLNRLNVAITRARSKAIVFLPKPLLEPPIAAFEDEDVAEGIAFMQGLEAFARSEGQETVFEMEGDVKLDLLRVPS